MGAHLGDAATDSLLVVVVLEGRLDRESLRGRVLDQGAFDVDGSQVAAKGHGAGSDDGVEGQPQSGFEVVEPQQSHLQDELSTDYAVVQRRVASGEEDALIRQVSAAHILLDDPVAGEQVLHVLDERNHADALRQELAHPILDGLAIEERLLLLPHNDLLIVGLDQGDLLRRRHHGKDDFLDGRGMLVPVEAACHVPGRGHTLQGLNQGLAHVALDAGIGHTQGQGYVAAKLELIPEEVRVAG